MVPFDLDIAKIILALTVTGGCRESKYGSREMEIWLGAAGSSDCSDGGGPGVY